MTASQRVARARAQLIHRSPWFATLAFKLTPVELPAEQMKMGGVVQMPTMATDGTRLYYCATFVESLTDEQLIAIICHETMHCALQHMYRLNGRDLLRANIAMDLAINPLIKSAVDSQSRPIYNLPEGCLLDPQFDGLTWEVIYNKLPPALKSPQGGRCDCLPAPESTEGGDGKDGKDKSKGDGGSTPSPRNMTATDWEIAVEQASRVAPGTAPAGFDRMLQESRPRVDWRDVLPMSIQSSFRTEETWCKSNRRTAWLSPTVITPGNIRDGQGTLVFVVDTSGSVGPEMLSQVWAEVRGCCEQSRPEKVIVLWCDAEVAGVDIYSGADSLPDLPHAKGGGGTAFIPAFDWVRDNEGEVNCLIYLTDLESSDEPSDPGYPVVWVVPEWQSRDGWFGETIRTDL